MFDLELPIQIQVDGEIYRTRAYVDQKIIDIIRDAVPFEKLGDCVFCEITTEKGLPIELSSTLAEMVFKTNEANIVLVTDSFCEFC